MAYNASRKAREKRLRARYRKKIWTAAIIMLVIGLILGFVACVTIAQRSDRIAGILKLAPAKDASTADAMMEPEETADPEAVLAFEEALEYEEFEDFEDLGEFEEFEEFENFEDFEGFEDLEEPEVDAEVVTAPSLAVAEVSETEEESAAPLTIAEPEATQIAAVLPVETEAPTAEPTVEPTPVPTAVPTPEPTAEPTPEPTPEPIIVPYGQAQTFKTQVKADGSARRAADSDAYETLELTLKVDAYKDPAYFEANYSDTYNLQGNEAAVEFDITLNGYTGATEIIPQNFLLITFRGEDEGVTSQGFQLMDTEIAGKTNIAIASDATSTLFKRYPYNADQGDMTYMVVNTYNDGVESTYLFEIQAPVVEAPAETAASTEAGAEEATNASTSTGGTVLSVGSKGPEVSKLQSVLIQKGLLSGQPDGHYGNYTATAVKELQRKFGMEQTGIADQAFLDKLYS